MIFKPNKFQWGIFSSFKEHLESHLVSRVRDSNRDRSVGFLAEENKAGFLTLLQESRLV